MKTTFFAFIILFFASVATAQSFQGTLKPGSQANSVIIAIKSDSTFSGIPEILQLTVTVPKSAGERPIMSVLNNFYSSYYDTTRDQIPYQLSAPSTEYNNDYVYSVYFPYQASTQKAYTANKEDSVVELLFTGNIGNRSDIKLVQLPNGLGTSDGGEYEPHNFYIQFDTGDRTNTSAMFYSTTGGTVNNNAEGYSAYSEVNAGSGVLPLNWVSFYAQKQKNDAILRWEVANEYNNSFYEILSGPNPNSMISIGKVPSVATKNVYTFTDTNFNKINGENAYYTIKQVDKDGKFSYSEIKKVSINGKEFLFNITGNPVYGKSLGLRIRSFDNNNNNGIIRVVDLNGKQVLIKNITWSAGYTKQLIELPELSKGIYILTLTRGKEQYQTKFIN